MENIDAYPKWTRGVTIRYMPPGYLAELAGMVRMDLNSADRREDKIGFLGGMGYRHLDVQQAYENVLGGRLFETYTVWTPEQYARWIEMYPLQLNTHKHQTCCPRTNAPGMETFRMSLLLSFQACMISAPSHQQDEHNFGSMIRFAEVEQTLKSMKDIISGGVRDCQSK